MQVNYFGYALPDPFRDSGELERLYNQDLVTMSAIELEGERVELLLAASKAHKQTHKAVYIYVGARKCCEALEWLEHRIKAIAVELRRRS